MKLENQWIPGNRLLLLENGEEYFQKLLEHIQKAQKEIILETYIFAEDKVGRSVSEALQQAVRRGVQVYMVVDGIGSSYLSYAFFQNLRQAGINVYVFKPPRRFFYLGRDILRRLHRKMCVIDRRTAFVGGINFCEQQLYSLGSQGMLDYAVKIEGPLVEEIHKTLSFFLLRLQKEWFEYFSNRFRRKKYSLIFAGTTRAIFVVRDNLQHRKQIEKYYLKLTKNAQKEIVIANAYFFPRFIFLKALIRAVRRGVAVHLLLQGRSDQLLVKRATEVLYKMLLKGGVHIYEYEARILHAKAAVFDTHLSFIGSSNLDPTSLLLSLEANVLVEDSKLGHELKTKLIEAIRQGAKEIRLESIPQQKLLKKIVSWCCYWLLRLFSFVSS